MKLQRIPTTRPPSMTEFADYIAAPHHPLVVAGAMDDWPAMQRWSLEFFAREFADFPVAAHAPQFPALAHCAVRTTLAKYVDYLRDPCDAAIDGEWVKGDPETLKASGMTLYAGNFNPAHPTYGNRALVFRDVPPLPPFIDCWMGLLEPSFRDACERLQSHHYVYLSIPGGVTPLHQDFWETHAFLAQITGRKHAVLFHPELATALYEDPTGDVRRMMRNPRYTATEGWETELTPGDLLIIPSGWLHYVETLETSVTYSADWIDASNWRAYVRDATEALRRREARRR